MPSSVTTSLTGCDLRMWGFAAVPDEACIECYTCNAKYSMDKLRRVAVRHANACNTAQVIVYCCMRPAISGARSIDSLARCYSVDCRVDQAIPEQLPREPEPQSDKSNAKREAPAACRWCKGKREITVNFKTKPCDCVEQGSISCGWEALLKDAKTTAH